MGLYLRKSIKVGPFRLNLSGSGVGVSTGIPGLRFGTGPRGNYIHVGRGGIYFRKTLPHTSSRETRPLPPQEGTQDTVGPMVAVDSAPITGMVNAASEDFVREVQQKLTTSRLAPLVGVGGLVLGLLLSVFQVPPTTWLGAVLLFSGAWWFASQRDEVARTTVIFYNLEPDVEVAYQGLLEAFTQIGKSSRLWHVGSEGTVLNRKYHAGAGMVVGRQGIHVSTVLPDWLRVNVPVPVLPVGAQTLGFLPDRVLIWSGKEIGTIGYGELICEATPTSFIESSAAPPDARVTGYTYKYVNKSGGPDRRFRDNPQMPICQYGELQFSSNSGINEVVQVSLADAAFALPPALKAMAEEVG